MENKFSHLYLLIAENHYGYKEKPAARQSRGRKKRSCAGEPRPEESADMTEKTEERERGGGEAGTRRQEGGGPPPRSYSEFMRNLAAKYNTDTSPE